MSSENQLITFAVADSYYARLKELHDGGILRDDEFDSLLKRLMVRDDRGHWWVRSRGTGEWHYNAGTHWIRGTPPYEPLPPSPEAKTPSQTPSLDDLLRICARYDGPRFYVGDAIPRRQLSMIRSRFPIPIGERVAALVDSSPPFSNGFGLAVCMSGLRWRALRQQVGKRNATISTGSLAWRDFIAVTVKAVDRKPAGRYNLQLGEGNILEIDNAYMSRDSLVKLLTEIQTLITGSSTW